MTFAWSVEEETGLAGAAFIAEKEKVDTVFAVDTFVSSDSRVDSRRLGYAPLGKGAVLRGLDNRTLAPAEVMDRITALAKESGIPLQIGVTGGDTDASPVSAKGAPSTSVCPGRAATRIHRPTSWTGATSNRSRVCWSSSPRNTRAMLIPSETPPSDASARGIRV